MPLFAIFLFKDIELRVNAFTSPALVNGSKVFARFGLLSLVAGFLDPFVEEVAVVFQFAGESGIVGEVVDLMRIFFEIVEFFGRAFSEEGPGWDLPKFTFGVELAKALGLSLSVAILGLEENTIGHEVAEVAELFGPYGADAVDRVIATITGRDDVVPCFVVVAKEIFSVEVVREFNASKSERGGGDIKTTDKFVAGGILFDAWS